MSRSLGDTTAASAALVSADWCVAEVASALGIKQRAGQLDAPQAQWLKIKPVVFS